MLTTLNIEPYNLIEIFVTCDMNMLFNHEYSYGSSILFEVPYNLENIKYKVTLYTDDINIIYIFFKYIINHKYTIKKNE
jgi:hypothetical protein